MRTFTLFLIVSYGVYAQEGLKRLEDELKYLEDREVFLYLPKRDILFEKTDEIKTSSSALLKPTPSEESKSDLLEEMEKDSGFNELPINAPQIN